MAKRAGVSRSAVSRTFTAGASVAPETRERVIAAAHELGYRVNMLARSLSQKRTNLVALVVSDMDHSFRAAVIDQLARKLVRLNYRPFMLPTDPRQDVSHLIDMMLHYNVSGAIVTSDTPPAEIAEECAAHGVPLVLVNKQPMDGAANVTLDSDKVGRLAATALKRAGCKRVALASQKRPSHSINQRKQAFMRHCPELGLDLVGDFQGAAQNYDGGVEAADAFLNAQTAADGVFCVNDYLALGFLDRLRHGSDIRVPGDLRVVGCDDIAEAAWLSYDLTTIRQDSGLLTDAAVDALVSRIDDPEATPLNTVIDVKLVERGSTGSIHVGDAG
ncbi:LacI family DNA-binding transcriptional regulator [Oricola sp.]|uniref:LacI family DNA-binding transcriptional regulator n=1 Tax=Oricola sp. TaxID=1979950 RepID=UPI0025CB881E|nr:LacI family DNA-binding transcriptional regulator [Oricola sp.]MCI5076923.1 LacI family DNA-binding transcriptional regulator [Oricola sp.]